MLTTAAHHGLDLNPGSHGCETNAFNAVPRLLEVNRRQIQPEDWIFHEQET